MRRVRSQRLLLIFTIVFGTLFLAIVAGNIALQLLGLMDQYKLIEIIFAIASPVFLAIFILIITYALNDRGFFKSMMTENKYYFGKERQFFNYVYFERIVNRKKRFKRGEQYVIAFTASDYNTMRNSARNDAITIYSSELASAITKLIRDPDSKYNKKNFTYCYYHGAFLLYCWTNENVVRNLIHDLEKVSYDIPVEQNLRVFVQPFFGVYKVTNRKEDLFVCIDNAQMARAQSERYFETTTFYSPALRKSSSIEEVEEISEALKNGEFVVFYQPKFHLASKKFISSEALIRWDSKKHGLLDPSKFISKAEYGGLIHELDMYVFRKVCEDLNETRRRGRRVVPVSINFSLYEFYSPNFITDLMNIIDENKVPTSLIEIEVTETTSQSNPFVSISIMKKLRERGLKILMDDFGVGFSNFKSFKNMPIDTIKIDKSFIDEIVTDTKSRAIVTFLIQLSKVNGLEVIAEGVDNKEQVEILRKAKCDTIQGFYYSRPLAKADYEKFLLSNEFEKKGAID